jgi:hypothetical protein
MVQFFPLRRHSLFLSRRQLAGERVETRLELPPVVGNFALTPLELSELYEQRVEIGKIVSSHPSPGSG